MARVARVAALLPVLALGVLGVGCGSQDGTTATTAAPAPSAAPAVSGTEIDLCAALGQGPPAAFLAALGQGGIDQEQGKSADGASVCGWFLAPVGDASPEGVLVRVEPVSSTSATPEVCRERTGTTPLPMGDSTGWVTESGDRVEAAVTTDRWCAYARGPAGVTAGPERAAAAATALLTASLASLPDPG